MGIAGRENEGGFFEVDGLRVDPKRTQVRQPGCARRHWQVHRAGLARWTAIGIDGRLGDQQDPPGPAAPILQPGRGAAGQALRRQVPDAAGRALAQRHCQAPAPIAAGQGIVGQDNVARAQILHRRQQGGAAHFRAISLQGLAAEGDDAVGTGLAQVIAAGLESDRQDSTAATSTP